jgi:heat shock protein beta
MYPRTKAFFLLVLLVAQNLQVFANIATAEGFTDEQLEEFQKATQPFEFQAEVGRLMDIIINSLYTNKEIFLRELISNASDALDKIRFLAVSDPSILKELNELAIRIEFDAEAHTISISDSGIGMTKQNLIDNLGTIAKSGTTNFVEALAKENSLNLIGQFGVGFYSTFLAGNKVSVISKHNEDDQYIWESSAASVFTVTKDPRGNTIKRGTKIIIDLKQDSFEFANQDKLKSLIRKYSEFINFPIYLKTENEVTREVPDEDAAVDAKEDVEKKEDDLEIKDADENAEPKPKTKSIKEKVWDWELINDNKALWLRNKDEIEEEDYFKFYKSIAKDYDEPLTYIHFQAEGEVEFKSILFIPKRAPFDMFENYYQKPSGLKLYVRRVLISEKFEDLMPRYLNFVKGVIDSDDLPINVSRETLQQLRMIKVMGKKVVRKALEMIKKLAEAKDADDEEEDSEYESESSDEVDKKEDKKEESSSSDENEDADKKKKEKAEKYNTFWKEFGKNLKLGIIEDASNRNRLAELTRWHSTKEHNELTSFDDYIERMKEGQDSIFFLGGESRELLLKSPTIQGLLKRGYEVLLLDDPVDEFCMQHLNEYEKKKLVNVGKGDFKMPQDDEVEKRKMNKLKKLYEPLTDWWKKVLSEQLENVVVSDKLVEDPAVVVASSYGYSSYMEKIQKAQAYGNNSPQSNSKKILEINPSHPVIKELLERVKDPRDEVDNETKDLATLLYEAALLHSGFSITDTHSFSERFFKIFNGALGVPKNAKVEEVHIDLDESSESDEPPKHGNEEIIEEVKPEDIKVSYGEDKHDHEL